MAMPMIVATCLASVSGCKPSTSPPAGQNQLPQESVAPSPAGAKRRPEADDLARFLRGEMPKQLKLADLKADPPLPLPGAAPP